MTEQQTANTEQIRAALELPNAAANEKPPQIKNKKNRRILYIFFVLMLLCFGSINGIPLRYFVFPFLSKTFHGNQWLEQVQLSDGSGIVVKRGVFGDGVIYRGKRSFEMKGEYVLGIQYNGESDYEKNPIFMTTSSIVLIDRNSQGQWFFLTHGGDVKNGVDCNDYKQYVLIDEEWQLVELDKALHGREKNLLWGYHEKIGAMPAIIKLSDKNSDDKYFTKQNKQQNTIKITEKSNVCES